MTKTIHLAGQNLITSVVCGQKSFAKGLVFASPGSTEARTT